MLILTNYDLGANASAPLVNVVCLDLLALGKELAIKAEQGETLDLRLELNANRQSRI